MNDHRQNVNKQLTVVNVRGQARLSGTVEVSAAKNSMLRLMVGSLLTEEECVLYPYPKGMLDAEILCGMLEVLGKKIVLTADQSLSISEEQHSKTELRWSKRSIRSTVLIAAALLARKGSAVVPNPGGCAIGDAGDGERKIDLHLMIFEKMGASYYYEDGYLILEAPSGLKGAEIHLPIRSTGATESAILAGTLAQGTTTIWGPHVRPEIIDLMEFLRSMGAKIEVYGQERIVIHGVPALKGAVHRCIPDNVEALSWVVASAVTGGDIEIHNFPTEHLEVPLIHMREAGVRLFIERDTAIVRLSRCQPLDIATGPYPGINSDMQPLFAAMAAHARGESRIVDLRFPGRYQYAQQFERLGVKVEIVGNMLKINGGMPLKGAEVVATDLRAGIALLIAGLGASGMTSIREAWQIERGYDGIWEKLKQLGAVIDLDYGS